MTDLERRALLGDKQAQEECTRQGILLPCPFCGGSAEIEYSCIVPFEYSAFCVDCGVMPAASGNRRTAISAWNTRPTPPIGRCKDCQYSGERDENGHSICQSTGSGVAKTDFCSEFQPKGK